MQNLRLKLKGQEDFLARLCDVGEYPKGERRHIPPRAIWIGPACNGDVVISKREGFGKVNAKRFSPARARTQVLWPDPRESHAVSICEQAEAGEIARKFVPQWVMYCCIAACPGKSGARPVYNPGGRYDLIPIDDFGCVLLPWNLFPAHRARSGSGMSLKQPSRESCPQSESWTRSLTSASAKRSLET